MSVCQMYCLSNVHLPIVPESCLLTSGCSSMALKLLWLSNSTTSMGKNPLQNLEMYPKIPVCKSNTRDNSSTLSCGIQKKTKMYSRISQARGKTIWSDTKPFVTRYLCLVARQIALDKDTFFR